MPPPPPAAASLSGRVLGAGQAVAGARLSLYAAGGNGYGRGSSLLAQASSASDGSWKLQYDCPSGSTQVYLLAAGGRPGGGDNPQLVLLAALGACTQAPGQAVVDELSTVAAVFALAQFLDGTGQVLGTSAGNPRGLANAAANLSNLFDPATGLAPATPAAGVTPSAALLNTLANLIGACVDSAGGRAGDGSACGALFEQAAPPQGAAPVDTLQALLDIARNPGHNVAALYALAAGSAAFTPALAAAPSDWLPSLRLSGGGLSEPSGIAIDAQGNAWVADHVRKTRNADGSYSLVDDLSAAVSKFAPGGAALSGDTGFSGGGLMEASGLAVDAGGGVWVANRESAKAVNAGLGSVAYLRADGSFASGATGFTAGGVDYPLAVAVNQDGNVWVANSGSSTLSRLGPDGGALSPQSGFAGAGLNYPTSLAIDAGSYVWVSDTGADRMSLLTPAGAAQSPAAGYADGAIAGPQQVCVDPAGDVWVPAFSGNSVARLAGAGGDTPGALLSPTAGYTGGGLYRPSACAIDGGGQVWVANFHDDEGQDSNLSLLSGAGSAAPGTALSGSAGLLQGQLSLPYALAIDASGNIWISNFGDDTLTVVLGAATPVKTPLIGPPALP